jgi:pimeloyl-ACP methyl ester carboxylesterase
MMRTMASGGRTMLRGLVRMTRAAALAALLAAIPSASAQVAPPTQARGADAVSAAEARDTRELVILVHGMGRSPASMWVLGRRLEADGYRVVNFGYRSTRGSVAELGARLGRRAAERTGGAPRVHFVGHSLGTVIIRSMLAQAPPERVGRVVMMAPPNQGAASADRWAPVLGGVMPPIRELRTTPESPARTLALPEGVEVGIIAGSRDRKVRLGETRLDGARDHVVIPSFHSWMMNRSDVHRLIATFLRHGRFSPAKPAAVAP